MKTRKGTHIVHFGLSAVFVALVIMLTPYGDALADEYDPHEAGHPLRLAAYILHPVGVLFDYGLMRPAHWIVHQGPLSTIFGHEVEPDRAEAL